MGDRDMGMLRFGLMHDSNRLDKQEDEKEGRMVSYRSYEG